MISGQNVSPEKSATTTKPGGPARVLAGAVALSLGLVPVIGHSAPKPSIALVHGAWEEANIMQGVNAKLTADGYNVIVVTLPGRPSSPLAPDKVSLDLYRDTVLQAIAKETTPVVLVGHSFAGITISNVAESAPEKIKTLVYVAAYLPQDGESLLSIATSDKDSKIGPHLMFQKEKGIVSIEYSARADLLVNDGSDGLRKAITDLVVDEPLAPLATPVHLTAARFGSVDKVYVHTAKDQIVSPSLQDTMVARTPVRLAVTLDTGHTLLLLDPDRLVKVIEQAAQ
jgi:pimeloyl-ACP methyl ester carboxylesterase